MPVLVHPPRRIRQRLAVLLAGGVVFIGAALLFWWCFLALPVGEGPAGPTVPAEPFQQLWGDRPVVLLGVGDSVTAGYGAPPEKAFMARLVQNPEDEFADMQGVCLSAVLPNLEVQNVAVSGSDSLQHAEKQLPDLKPFPEEVFGIVIMTSGGNDLIHWYGARPPREGAMYGATLEQAQLWITNFEQRLTTMLNRLVDLFPGGCHIFLGNIYDPSDGGADPRIIGLPPWDDALDILAKYNAVIARCAADNEHVTLVDLYGAFLGHGVRCAQFWRETHRPDDPHYWYFDNIEDPNVRGHDALRRLFMLGIIEELGGRAAIFQAPE